MPPQPFHTIIPGSLCATHCSLDSSNLWYPCLAQGLCTSWLLILWGSAQTSFLSEKPSLSILCYCTLPPNFSTVCFFYSHHLHLRLSRVQKKSFQSHTTLSDPMDCSLPGSSVHWILLARILEWVAVPSCRGSSGPRDRTRISYASLHWQVGSLPVASPGKPEMIIFTAIYYLHWSSQVAQTVKSLSAMRETRVWSLIGKIPWRKKRQPTPVFLPGKFHGWRSQAGYSPWGRKEADTTERLTLALTCTIFIITSSTLIK